MKTVFKNCNVRAPCPDCEGAITTFEYRPGGVELGNILIVGSHDYAGVTYHNISFRLLRCAGCGRGALAKIHHDGNWCEGVLEEFFPFAIETAKLPSGVPDEIVTEFREAELDASYEAYRSASAMTRSVLEKTLKANGYLRGNLKGKINQAAKDGVITDARSKKAQQDIRVLGNDVLHQKWREVDEEEVTMSLHYAQRILEDLYDDREAVEAILVKLKRLPLEEEMGVEE